VMISADMAQTVVTKPSGCTQLKFRRDINDSSVKGRRWWTA